VVSTLLQVSHFRVSELSINHVTFVAGRELLLAACQDMCVHLYTYEGLFVGIFGEHLWSIDDPTTFQGPASGRPLPVLDRIEVLFRAAEVFCEPPGKNQCHSSTIQKSYACLDPCSINCVEV
jgi:hypothetical protein